MISVSLAMILLVYVSVVMVRRHKVLTIATRSTRSSLAASRQDAAAPQNLTEHTNPTIRDSISSEPRAETIVEVKGSPAELWKRVQRGSVTAEVELAKRYLDGNGVAQNCEQAWLLLSAASKKQSSAATKLLSGDFLRRCL